MADLLETLVLADTSAWHHSSSPRVSELWTRGLEEDRIATTAPVRLEVLFSARSGRDYDAVARELSAVRQLPCGEDAWSRALDVQRRLAHRKALHHRSVHIPDLLVAAVAEIEGVVVWHYDEDFDRIAEITGQPVEWVAPRGSLR
jgi:predicted nucleic acid-binding protein